MLHSDQKFRQKLLTGMFVIILGAKGRLEKL